MTNTINVDTPESVAVAYEPAGFGSRFTAALLDGLIQWGAVFLLLIAVVPVVALNDLIRHWASGASGGILLAVLLLILGFLFFGYKLLLEAFWNGQTVGKRALGIRVVQSSGMPAGLLSIVVRNLMRAVDYLPFNYLVGSIAVLASKHQQRLGDMVAGTVVVRERRVPAPLVPRGLSAEPPFDLTVLKERVLRLSEADLEPARSFWARRGGLEPKARARVGQAIAESLARKLDWTDPLGPTAEHFIEAVLYARARPL